MKVLVLATLFMIASNVQAASTCLKKESNLKQLINFASESKSELQPDLSGIVVVNRTNPQYTQLNGIGIVEIPGEQGYGTGFLVSPCHVLTNLHVVFNEREERKIGKDINFSVGQNGSTKNPFSNRYESGKVVAFGGALHNDSRTANGDWVVIKLSESIGNKVGYVNFLQMTLKNMNNRAVITAGFPGAKTENGADLKNIYGDLNCKMDGTDINGYVYHTCKTGPGSSGSPILALNPKDNKFYAIGMVRGREGGDLTKYGTPAIQTEEKTNRNTAVAFFSGQGTNVVSNGDKIAQAIRANKCN